MTTDFVKKEVDEKGRFCRQKTRFVTPFGDGDNELPVEKNRYRLLVSYACPWAHRQLIALKLLGLEDVISIGVVDPIRPTDVDRTDWAFTLDKDGRDPVLGIHYLSDIYLKTDPDYKGRFTVPAVVDLQTGQVVNNEKKLTSLMRLFLMISIMVSTRLVLQLVKRLMRKPMMLYLSVWMN